MRPEASAAVCPAYGHMMVTNTHLQELDAELLVWPLPDPLQQVVQPLHASV